jgi:hypothetical protein
MKHVLIKEKEVHKTKQCRYSVVCNNKTYQSLSHFAKSASVPVNTLTKLVSRRMRDVGVLNVTVNGYSLCVNKIEE